MTLEPLQSYESIRGRQRLLEALAQLLAHLHSTSGSLALVQNILLPSQTYSEALRHKLAEQISGIETAETQMLQARLNGLDAELANAATLFFRIARLDDEMFIAHYQGGAAGRMRFHERQGQLQTYQQRASQCLAVRLILSERGVQLARPQLMLDSRPLTQERLTEEIEQLHERERSHQAHLERELTAMIADTDLLLSVVPQNSPAVQTLSANRARLQQSLELLAQTGVIEQLPDLIEEIEYEVLPAGFQPAPVSAQKQVVEAPPAQQPFTKQSEKRLDTAPMILASNQPGAHKTSLLEPDSNPVFSEMAAKDGASPAARAQAETELDPSAENNPDSAIEPNSFRERLKIWMDTSWRVSWADTKYFRR